VIAFRAAPLASPSRPHLRRASRLRGTDVDNKELLLDFSRIDAILFGEKCYPSPLYGSGHLEYVPVVRFGARDG
jgi:hypothetical protein